MSRASLRLWRVENNLTSLRVQKLLERHDAQDLVYIYFRQKYWHSGLKRLSSERKIKNAPYDRICQCLHSCGKTKLISVYKLDLSSCAPSATKEEHGVRKLNGPVSLQLVWHYFCFETLSCTKKSYAESLCIFFVSFTGDMVLSIDKQFPCLSPLLSFSEFKNTDRDLMVHTGSLCNLEPGW